MNYLLFKAYPAGLNNNRMSLELAAGLAWLTRRTLVYYGAEPIQNSLIDPALRTPPGTPTVLDLFELPVDRVDAEGFGTTAADLRTTVLPTDDLLNSVIYYRGAEALDPVDFLSFRNGRPTTITLGPELDAFDVLHVEADTLGYYSYVFYLPSAMRADFLACMDAVKPRPAYEKFADAVVNRLRPFNAIHVRRQDFVTWPSSERTAVVTGSDIVDQIRSVIPADEPLLVCTDESDNTSFFAPIFAAYPRAYFIDRWILDDPSASRAYDELPFAGDIVMGLVSQLVTACATIFVGTMASTYTGVIQRMRGRRHGEEPFLYLYSQFEAGVPFESCELLPTASGPYTWNRSPLPTNPDTLGWFREWPESFIP